MNHQYFEATPSAPSAEQTISVVLLDQTVTLVTDTNVFSKDHLDLGTRILLETAPLPTAGPVCDLGCGYGPIAVAYAKAAPACSIFAVDINQRARELTARNAAMLHLKNVTVIAPDELPEQRYSTLYSNPPIRIGKALLHELLETWLEKLLPDGVAYFVVSKHLGGDSLAAWLNAQGFATERIASRSGYRIFRTLPRALPAIEQA